MALTAEQIIDAAMELPPDARAHVVRRLVEALHDDVIDSDADDVWADIVNRRIAEIRTGQVEPVPAATALEAARARLRAAR